MTMEEKLERLTTVVESVASAHASRIDGLIRAAEGHRNQIDAHDGQIEALIAHAEKQAAKNEEFDRRPKSLLASAVERP
jgi:hypothetical protein